MTLSMQKQLKKIYPKKRKVQTNPKPYLPDNNFKKTNQVLRVHRWVGGHK